MKTEEPALEHHHRDVQSGAARAAVLGLSDGLLTNVCLVLGVAGAHPAQGFVRLAGLAGLIGGAFSMGIGEYNSMRAQSELIERELEVERIEIERRPDKEQRELAHLYRSRGISAAAADEMAAAMHRDPQLALETHAREELGVNPRTFGSPVKAAATSFLSFGAGALPPLMPWFFTQGNAGVAASILIAVVTALAVGAALAVFTGKSTVRTALRQLVLTALAAGVTFAIGKAVGVSVA